MGNLDAVDARKIIQFNLRFRSLERPGHVVDIAAQQLPTAVGGEETIALSEKMLNRARAGFDRWSIPSPGLGNGPGTVPAWRSKDARFGR